MYICEWGKNNDIHINDVCSMRHIFIYMQMTRHNDRKDFSEILTEVLGSLCLGMHIYKHFIDMCSVVCLGLFRFH